MDNSFQQNARSDMDTKVKDITLYQRPQNNILRSNSSQSSIYQNQVLNSNQQSSINLMHNLFIVLLENGKEYILEQSEEGYNLEILTTSRNNFTLVKEVKLKKDFTLSQLKEITFTDSNQSTSDFAEEVMKKLNKNFSIIDRANLVYSSIFFITFSAILYGKYQEKKYMSQIIENTFLINNFKTLLDQLKNSRQIINQYANLTDEALILAKNLINMTL